MEVSWPGPISAASGLSPIGVLLGSSRAQTPLDPQLLGFGPRCPLCQALPKPCPLSGHLGSLPSSALIWTLLLHATLMLRCTWSIRGWSGSAFLPGL